MNRYSGHIALGSVCVLLVSLMAGTEPAYPQTKRTKNELPSSGVLSRSVTSGATASKVALPWGMDKNSAGLEEGAPITGSVSKVSDRMWTLKLFNTSKDDYSLDVRVVQRAAGGGITKTDSFSYRMKAGATVSRQVSAVPSTVDAQLVLVNWKNLSKKNTPAESPSAADAAKADTGEAASETKQ